MEFSCHMDEYLRTAENQNQIRKNVIPGDDLKAIFQYENFEIWGKTP